VVSPVGDLVINPAVGLGLLSYRRPPQTTADKCIFVLIFDIKDTYA